jgi:homoserine dehydrogenase
MTRTRIALLGFGNVGRSLIRYISERDDLTDCLEVAAVADSTGAAIIDSRSQVGELVSHKSRGGSIAQSGIGRLITSHADFIRSLGGLNVKLLVESLPTNIRDGQPALDLVRAALLQGTDVVTVDKGPLVRGFDELRQAAAASGAGLEFTGTTGVGIPSQLAGEKVLEIRGVLNGTTNYILTQMQHSGASFDEALRYAQQEGIAEPDPSLDVEGWDTACKILILAKALISPAMKASLALEDVARKGIGPETESLIRQAREMGRIARLVGRARIWQGRIRVSVAPKLIEPDSPFYSVNGTSKAAVFRTTDAEILAHGKSGRDAIAETIVEDTVRMIG